MNNLYIQILIASASSFVVCMILTPLVIQVSTRLNMMDMPDFRKVHKVPVPRLGGISIFFSALAGIVLSKRGLQAFTTWPILFSSFGLIFLVGIWDDFKNISARLRFVIQLCCATALAASGVRLTSLFGIFGIYEMQEVWQYVVTVLIIAGTTNAFNLIDGIDGLAGGLALISIMVLTYIAYQLQIYSLVILLVSFAGALIGFLRDNRSPAKIFMGDGGSLVLGYLMGSIGILLIEKSNLLPGLMPPSKVALLVTAILVIPVFDTIRVFTYRMRKGRSPFSADKMHIHHLFLIAGMDHNKTAYTLYIFALFLVGLAVVMPYATGVSITILVMVFLFHSITKILRINRSVEKWLVIIKKMEKEGIE